LKNLHAGPVIGPGRFRGTLPHIGSYLLTAMAVFGACSGLIYLALRLSGSPASPVPLMVVTVIVFSAAWVAHPALTRLQRAVYGWLARERYPYIEVLKRFNRSTAGTPELETIASSLVTAVVGGLQSLGVYLLLPSRATGGYSTYIYAGRSSREGRGRLQFAPGSPLLAILQQHDGAIDTDDMGSVPSLAGRAVDERQTLVDNGIELTAPLKNAGHLAGILLIGHKTSGEPYSKKDRRLLQAVAERVAVRIDDANYYESAKLRQSDMQKNIDGIVHAISLAVEVTDLYTAVHQRRVAELAAAIARQMGLTEWQTMGVRIAGLFHDVGKIAVPNEILNKPGKLDPYEFNIVRRHCRAGYEILEKIEFPWPVARAVLQHHERLDGSGYPLGLAAQDISFEARLLGVADVVEAMASHRPYRPSLGLEAALAEIKRGSGVLYDAEVVEACLALLSQDAAEFDNIMAAASQEREIRPEPVPA
jgi:putative nucleotidyltransferase with HDIG domain